MSKVLWLLLIFAVSVCVAAWLLWRRRRQLANVGQEPFLPTDAEAASPNAPLPESQISLGVLPGQDLERSETSPGTSDLSPQDVNLQRALEASIAHTHGQDLERGGTSPGTSDLSPQDVDLQRAVEESIAHTHGQNLERGGTSPGTSSQSPQDVDLQRAVEESIALTCGHGHEDVIATADISFKSAFTGQILDVGSIDLTLHVAVARECIARSLGVGDVRLLDAKGRILKDCEILCQLGVSEIGVSFAQKERMSVEALRARFQGLTVRDASFETCNGIYVPDDPFKERTMYRNQDCQSAVISWEGGRWTLRMDGSVIYSYDSEKLPRDGVWPRACDDGTGCQVSHRGAGSRCGALIRLAKELNLFDSSGCTAQVADTEIDNALDEQLLCWRISMLGPNGANFDLLMRFPADYPYNPPEVWFVTEIEHWSVRADGKMLMDILRNEWSPAMYGAKLITGIQAVLSMEEEPTDEPADEPV